MLLFIYALSFSDLRPIRTKDDKHKDMVLEIILKEFKIAEFNTVMIMAQRNNMLGIRTICF